MQRLLDIMTTQPQLKALLTRLTNQEIGYQLAKALVAVLILLTAFHLSSLWATWKKDSTMLVAASRAPRVDNDFLNIAAAHLFNQEARKSVDIPLTTLPLKLTGIIEVQGDSFDSKALILQEGASEQIYQEGDQITPQVKLAAIQADQVILNVDGHWERLLLQTFK